MQERPERVDPYRKLEATAGTDIKFGEVKTASLEPANVSLSNGSLATGARAIAAKFASEIELPPFVSSHGKIYQTQLTDYLGDLSNRMKKERTADSNEINTLNDQAALKILPWVTGIPRSPDQSLTDYLVPPVAERGYKDRAEKLGSDFVSAVMVELGRFGTRGRDDVSLPSNLTLYQVIKDDPANVCLFMLYLLSPREGTGHRVLGPALVEFRRVCLAD